MKHTYAFSDLHGCYDLWCKIKEYLQPEDTLYCLGDCIDRGPNGIKIVDEVKNRPNTFYIKGNHEDMAAATLKSYLEHHYLNDDFNLWFYNGGIPTWEKLEKKSKEELFVYQKYFENLPTYILYKNSKKQKIHLSHAGFSFETKKNLLWDRESFHTKFNIFYHPNDYIIHGHTPVQYQEFYFGYDNNHVTNNYKIEDIYKNWIPKAIWYNDNHKCNIDLGLPFSTRTMLLNLDTFEEVYFDE